MTDKEIAELAGIVLIQLIITFPICKIYGKAGYKWFWGLLTLVPIAGFFMIPGALGFAQWPSTTRAEVKSNGQHSLIWVAAFSALFLIGIPGADSEEFQSLLTLVFFVYITAGVASIYENAGFSRWGGIMGLLGITNLIWPWILAFRRWPTIQKIEEFNAAEFRYKEELELKRAHKYDMGDTTSLEVGNSRSGNSTGEGGKPSTFNEVPPPIPASLMKKQLGSGDGEFKDGNPAFENAGKMSEGSIYEQIAAELAGSQSRSEGAYLRAEVEANGNPEKIRLLYTMYRKAQLMKLSQ